MQIRNIAGAFRIGAVGVATVSAAFAAMAAAPVSAGDPKGGKLVFAKCAVCHSIVQGENRLGPSLAGIVGRKAGVTPNYAYSTAMKASGVVWTRQELDAYLANPRGKMPGVKMFFVGLPKPEDRANVIAYLAKPQ
jgi:cytochrome c